MRILVIAEETPLRNELTDELRRRGHVVDAVADGSEGFSFGNEHPVDIAVLDLSLPELSGTEILRRWRAEGRTFPVLALTGRAEWQDGITGLEAGADDYLCKPFHHSELLARLNGLIRRTPGGASSALSVGGFELRLGTRTVYANRAPVKLTAFEHKVLECLMLHAGEFVSKHELAQHLYDDDADCDSNVVEVLVARLRRKLDPKRTLALIETMRGRGYRLRLDGPRSASVQVRDARLSSSPGAGPEGRRASPAACGGRLATSDPSAEPHPKRSIES